MQISLFFIHCALTQQHGEESTIMIWTGDKEDILGGNAASLFHCPTWTSDPGAYLSFIFPMS